MQRCQGHALTELLEDLGIDTDTGGKALTSVHEAMADSVDLIEGGYEVLLTEDVEDDLYTTRVVGDG